MTTIEEHYSQIETMADNIFSEYVIMVEHNQVESIKLFRKVYF